MQGNNGHLPVFVAPANGSAGYTAGKVVPGRLPVPTKAPPPPPLKRLSPPPARPPPLHPSEDKARREHAQNLQRKNTYICTGVFLGAFFLTLIFILCLTSGDVLDENCPDHDPTLIDWNPGTGPRTPAVVRRGDRFRLVASASLQSLTIQSGGLVVFADDKDGSKNITLRTRHILIEDGGALHIGGPECRYRSRAIVGLVGRSDDAGATDVPGFGRKFVGVRPGGTLELHGARRLSWTLLTRTLPASGLSAGSYAFQKNFSRGINLRVVDQDTGARLHVERFDTHEHQNDSRRLSQLLRSLPPGRIVALAVGDSAVKSLLDETKKTIQDVLGSTYVNELQFRQAWALVSVVGGGNGSCTEAVREHENHDTRGRALAHRNFVTADGVRFAVTAYSEWRNGYASSGFTVDVEDQVVLDLQDDVSSWRPGERVVVASTDYSMHQAEEFTLLPCPHCTKRQVRIQGKPQFTHVGEIVDGVDMRAEVALLTRNILVHGEMESTCYGQNKCQFFSHDTFGGHIKILGNFSSVHLSQVELRHMGQQAVLGSYPVHFHRCGDVDRHGGYAQPAYVDSLAIHHSFSRCVVVHATNGLLVRDTVGYDTLGHCFFLEDGIEQRNVFFHNLGLVTRPGTILPTDRNDTMCTEIRDRVYKGHVPSPATECKAVSTFWIANPNNHLISNAAAGSQDAGIWYVFHSSSTGDSHGLVPETRAELTPLGIFYNNRIHSNFKAGLFIDKGVKTSNASAADPREYLCLDNSARFRPHENSDPAKPRVAALVDALISFKNNDLGAWIRGGDVIIQNSAFADNGVGLSFASDGSYPKDVGSSQEVADSLFVGESKNRGTNGGLNKYWGLGGVDGKLRTLPRNKTFPIRGFQIYDGPVRLLRSTFRAYAPTPERFTSAVGFNLKNTWQLTPRNNLSSLSFLSSVTLRAFFGRPGQWFEDNDLDGDKNSIFHDVDGSVSGYPGTYVARADNFLVRHPACVDVPQWNGCVCSGRYAQVYIKTQGTPNLGLSVTRDEYPERPMLLRGINSHGALSQQYQPVLMLTKSYTLHWSSQAPREVAISLVNFDLGDWAFLGLCYPSDTVFQVVSDIYDRQNNVFDGMEDYGSVSSLAELQKRPLDRKYFFDSSTGLLWLYVRAQHGRSGYSYCSVRGCERVKITATTSTKQTCNCTARAYPKYRKQPSATTPMPPPTTTPCTRCGASKLVFSSDPSSSYLQTQIKALSLVEEQNNDTRAFITVNAKQFNLTQVGFLVVAADACTGKVTKQSFFPKLDSKMKQHFTSGIPARSIVMLATRGQPDGFAKVAPHLVPLGAAKVADLQGRGSFAFFGFQGVATRPPWVSLLVGQGEEPVGMIERYIPLALEEYSCPLGAEPAKRKDLELLRKARR
ncbi:cell surface hyaluronidase isoform X1 [Electrophorus electricus]|uniref:hyaluronoglucosaminidase n=2 Tax=Electrophorus electricus TaxID=8005 RepID=A0A4W4GET0_ELEEL|nr:cell surface hyaluronidase isoform X1 [Electrophorus electricus]XP_035382478.1 cell surface hyaluronidase isoform X1 [Electrophorus electricus]